MSSQNTEHRIFERNSYKTKVVFEDEFGDGMFYLYSENISMGGMLLDSFIPIRTGTMLLLSFNLPPKNNLVKVTGEVIRSLYPSRGMGIRFVGLTNDARDKLETFLLKP
ncbi:MAG: hypothetical protein COS89_08230 [Deltaproteobacteria bacterium CG07_land_8_20_14_0_80_38_7]|nr:MAG: hypothetical protein COS89_08230 [Deltaproteobacteria bacterium CG07_land_8_20_14_0_80_38_7]